MDSISRTSTSKFRRITSAVGTTLLQSPGCMRAKPEMEPWVNTDKSGLSSVGAALSARAFGLWLCIR